MYCLFILLISIACSSSKSGESVYPRIISLTPAVTSILMDLGMEKNIVGVTSNDFFLERESVGNLIQFSLEKILMLKPDFIFYQDFQKNWIGPLSENKKFIMAEFALSDLNSIFRESRKMAALLHLSDKSIQDREERIKAYAVLYSQKKFTYVAVVDRDPDFKRVYAAGRQSYLSQVLEFLGGENLIQTEKDYVLLSEEVFISKKKPQVIIDFSLNQNPVNSFRQIPVLMISDQKITIPDLRFEDKILVLKKILNQLNL